MVPGPKLEPQNWALATGHWEDVSDRHTCQPMSSSARPRALRYLCIPVLPLGRRAHSLALVCPPVKWGDSCHPSHMEEAGAQ